MSDYRHNERLAKDFGTYARERRAMLSLPDIDSIDDDIVATVEAPSADPGENEVFQANVCTPIGLVGRPEQDDEVSAFLSRLGGSFDHPVVASVIEWLRVDAIRAFGLAAGERLLYSARAGVKLVSDGTVAIRSWAGTAEPLATRADVERVNARVDELENWANFHIHAGVTTGPGISGVPQSPSLTSATIEGTSVLKGE